MSPRDTQGSMIRKWLRDFLAPFFCAYGRHRWRQGHRIDYCNDCMFSRVTREEEFDGPWD